MARLEKALSENNNKIPLSFLEEQAKKAKVTYSKPTANTRVCVLTLPEGHEVIGYSRVIDSVNDVASIGNKVAYNNAFNELWGVYGSIAKLMI